MNAAVPVLLALAAAGPAPAPPASAPDGLAASRIQRGALLALPSVYTLTALTPRRGGGLPHVRSGLAFAVRPDGTLVTALHVVAPDRGRAPVVEVAQLRPAAGAPARVWRARVLTTDADHDLAVLRIGARGIPALVTGPRAAEGTPLAVFEASSGVAATRTGLAGPTQLFTHVVEDEATRMRVAVRRGDSGGPAVDADGRVRGVVRAFLDDPREALLEPADHLDLVLAQSGRRPAEGIAAARFRRGMRELWSLQPDLARQDLRAAVTAFGAHTLAARELAGADVLQDSGYRIGASGARRGGLLAVGVACALAAACFGVALAGFGHRRRA